MNQGRHTPRMPANRNLFELAGCLLLTIISLCFFSSCATVTTSSKIIRTPLESWTTTKKTDETVLEVNELSLTGQGFMGVLVRNIICTKTDYEKKSVAIEIERKPISLWWNIPSTVLLGGLGTYLLIDSGQGEGEGHAFDRTMGVLFVTGATVFAVQSIRAMACSRDVTRNQPDEIGETTTKAVCGAEHEPYTSIRIVSDKLNVDEIVETDENGSFSVQASTVIEPGTIIMVSVFHINGFLIGEYEIES